MARIAEEIGSKKRESGIDTFTDLRPTRRLRWKRVWSVKASRAEWEGEWRRGFALWVGKVRVRFDTTLPSLRSGQVGDRDRGYELSVESIQVDLQSFFFVIVPPSCKRFMVVSWSGSKNCLRPDRHTRMTSQCTGVDNIYGETSLFRRI